VEAIEAAPKKRIKIDAKGRIFIETPVLFPVGREDAYGALVGIGMMPPPTTQSRAIPVSSGGENCQPSAAARPGSKTGDGIMGEELKYQLRLTLSDAFAKVARDHPDDPSIAPLTQLLCRHDATLKCQYDAFADYVREAEAKGVEAYPLYAWTKKTVDDPAKEAKYTKSFTLYVDGEEVYERSKADALEAELKLLVGGPIVARMFRYDTDPAHNPQPPHASKA
jgi:hypothetical protein